MLDKLRIEFVDDVHHCWRWFSMWAMGSSVVLLATWEALPDDLKAALPSHFVQGVAIFILIAGMMGRTIKQKPPKGLNQCQKPPQPPPQQTTPKLVTPSS